MRCVFQFKQKNNFFFTWTSSSSGAHWPKHNNFFFYFAFCNGKPSKNINPQSCLSTKRYFYFLFNWTHKKLMCVHHIIDVFFVFFFLTFHVLHKSIYYTIFFPKTLLCTITNNGPLTVYTCTENTFTRKIRLTQLMPLIWFHSTR